jgi:hypothetical protein
MTSIIPGKEYTKAEIAAFRDSPELAGLLFQGYVLALTLGGNFQLIPYHQAAGGGHSGTGTGSVKMGSQQSTYGLPKVGTFDKRELPPIVKRTPQQRVDSLMKRAGEDLKLYLAGKQVKEVAGEDTKQKVVESLTQAEKDFEIEESKKIVRTTGSQYV